MANFKETDQTYKDMDARFETLLNIAPLTQSNLTKIYSTFNKTSSPPGQQNHKVLMKYYKDGDLKSFMARSNNNILPGQRLKLMNNLYAAVEYMHQNRFSHNRIAPEHVLIDEGAVYLGGLSSAKHHPSGLPVEIKNKEITDLGGSLCFILFYNQQISNQTMENEVNGTYQLSLPIKSSMLAWLNKASSQDIQNLINSGEQSHHNPSFTNWNNQQFGEQKHIPISFQQKESLFQPKTGGSDFKSDIFDDIPKPFSIQPSEIKKVGAYPNAPDSFNITGGYF
jgi:hypothetical protein